MEISNESQASALFGHTTIGWNNISRLMTITGFGETHSNKNYPRRNMTNPNIMIKAPIRPIVSFYNTPLSAVPKTLAINFKYLTTNDL